MRFTAVFQEVDEGYIGFVEEVPGANIQGAMLEEARENLHEAVELILQANRELAREALGAAKVIREPFKIAGWNDVIWFATCSRMAASCFVKAAAEGSRHSVYINRESRKLSRVPRHREINDHLARKICRDLETPDPAG